MTFLSLRPFIPSGPDFDKSLKFFEEIGFTLQWNQHGYAGFENGSCAFILQQYDSREFAENLMITVNVPNIEEFQQHINEKKLIEKYGTMIGEITRQPYGRELNIIDPAGVCWHFVQS